ncbi:MAG TPA: class I SAM-dependent methyltransferase [Polyangia bacterium]|nr:class I SAM-dependent methyltransferase [Polyangia bacterium]
MPSAAPCPLCARSTGQSIFELRDSPLLQNKLLPTAAEARAVERVTALYLYCPACHFAFNPEFDPAIVDYRAYYNSQIESPAYRGYVDRVARDLVANCGLGPQSRVLEVGCGSGYFLSRLREESGSDGLVGFDPTYRGEHGVESYVRRGMLDARQLEGTFDLVVFRHSLEGLLDDGALVDLVRGSTSASTRLYFEISDLDHLLAERNPSLLFYEYYRYFSARAADIFLRQLGFRLRELWSLFGGAYLGVIATRAPVTTDLRGAYDELEAVVLRHRKVVIWGTSGRCISLLSHLGWDASVVAFGVDIDPAKQGLFLPVTGQRVLSPEEAAAFRPDLVIVANGVYAPEIRKQFPFEVQLVSLRGGVL